MKNCSMQPGNMSDGSMRDSRMDGRMDSRMDASMDARRAGEMCYMRENDAYRCESYPIGMGYVPWQTFKDIYDPERGLEAGTIFAELEKPFWGRRGFRR